MAKVRVQDLAYGLLDWAVAKAAGFPTRVPIAATDVDIAKLATPFTLYEVGVCPDPIRAITITRCTRGDDVLSPPGCIPDGYLLHYVTEDGAEGLGYPEDFYLNREEAELALFERDYGEISEFLPSQNWSQAGPLLEEEGIRTHRSHTGEWWAAPEANPSRPVAGPTLLYAAMRCFVISKLGEHVEVPDELLERHQRVWPAGEPQRPARPRG